MFNVRPRVLARLKQFFCFLPTILLEILNRRAAQSAVGLDIIVSGAIGSPFDFEAGHLALLHRLQYIPLNLYRPAGQEFRAGVQFLCNCGRNCSGNRSTICWV